MSATSTANEVIAALCAAGVRDFVLSPGSRNAPFALALADLEQQGRIRLHVRIDERSAGFLALGLARGSRRPVAVVTTSGTAAVELHPAMVEAAHTGVPLIAVTADRPAFLRGTGASQTIDQVGLFAPAIRRALDVDADTSDLASRIADLIDGTAPVHINVQLVPPLVPGLDESTPAIEVGQPPALTPLEPRTIEEVLGWAAPERGLVLLGDIGDDLGLRTAACDLADRLGWPVIAEVAGGGPGGGVLAHGPVAIARDLDGQLVPEVLVTLGTFGVSRPVLALAGKSGRHVAVSRSGLAGDPTVTAEVMLDAVPISDERRPAGPWLAQWRTACDAVADADLDGFTGLSVARTVWEAANTEDVIYVGASWSLRAVEAVAPYRIGPPRLVANRGTNGIDGSVSIAWGIATGTGRRTIALIGDLTFLYDHNGLLAPALETRPDLTIVVVDNDGGGIFHQLEQGKPEYSDRFERVFGTPHGLDLVAVSEAAGIPAVRVEDQHSLLAALVGSGVRIVVAKVGTRATELASWRTLLGS